MRCWEEKPALQQEDQHLTCHHSAKGARLRAINPGTWIEPDTAFDALIDRCAAEGWTLEIPPSVTEQWRYFSGRDQERAGELARAWADPSIDAVISLGGGWGSARVLEAGFHSPAGPNGAWAFQTAVPCCSPSGPLGYLGPFMAPPAGPTINGNEPLTCSKGRPVAPLDGRGIVPGIGEGPLVVTNLTVGTHLIGTPWMPHLDGTILVLRGRWRSPIPGGSDVDPMEKRRAFGQGGGVACGRFSWMEDDIRPGDFSMEEVLENRLGGLGVPLV